MDQIKHWFLTALIFLQAQACTIDNAPLRIMPLGDSITFGSNYPGAYRIKLEKLLSDAGNTIRFVGSMTNGPTELKSQANEGHNGWETHQLLEKAAEWIDTYKPDIVLLMSGTNDVAMDDVSQVPDLTRIKNEYSSLIDSIFQTRPQVRLVVATIPPTNGFWNQYVVQFNAEIRNLVAEKATDGKNIGLADVAASLTLADMDPVDLPIYVHPSANGYDKIAETWFRVLFSGGN